MMERDNATIRHGATDGRNVIKQFVRVFLVRTAKFMTAVMIEEAKIFLTKRSSLLFLNY